MSDTTSSAAEAAKHYAARGWRPIILHGVNPETGRCTCKDANRKVNGEYPEHSSAGKHPVEREWEQTAPMTDAEIDAAWSGWRRNHNVGIATGAPSGFWVLDIDPDNGGLDGFRQLVADHGALPATAGQVTGSGGWHLLFQMPADFDVTNRNKGLKGYPGLDVRGTGGQIVAAPSTSAKGSYAWLGPDRRPAKGFPNTPIAEAPEWLLELLRPRATEVNVVPASQVYTPAQDDAEQARLEAYATSVRDAEVGRLVAMSEAAGDNYQGEPWNDTTFAVACALLELANSPWTVYDVSAAHSDLIEHAPRDSGFTNEDVRGRWDSAVTTVGKNARKYPEERQTTSDSIMSDWLDDPDVRVDPILMRGPQKPGGSAPSTDDDRPAVPPRTWDDLGNAFRVVDHFGKVLRWVHEPQKWALYKGGAWTMVEANVVQGYIQRMIDQLIPATEALNYSNQPIGEPPAEGDEDNRTSEREAFFKWLKAQRMSARIAACQQEARARHELHASMGDFDCDPMLFNVANGVVDLRTGELTPARPDMMLMRRSPVAYDPEAHSPTWEAFLDRMMPDFEMQAYLQRILGYSLTGSVKEQAFFIHHGDGANGKSVCTDAIGAIVGDYGHVVAASTLLSSAQEEHPTGVAMMQGKRWLPATETAAGKRLDEEKIKNLTGDALVTARYMRQDFFQFEPTGKLHLITNHLPFLSDAKSIWRRIHLIRWGVSLPESEWDTRLGQKLAEEYPGILTWLVAGAKAWHNLGRLNPPAPALADKEAYRGDSDIFGDFLRERTMPAPGSTCTVEQMYRAYTSWCFDQGIRKPFSQQSFVATMLERKVPRGRTAQGKVFKDITTIMPQQSSVAAPVAPLPWDD